VSLTSNLYDREIAPAPILLEGPIQDNDLNQLCGVQDPKEPEVEDDGSTPRSSPALLGSSSRRAAIRRELLKSHHFGMDQATEEQY
jgi:hypothetical protein